MLRLLRSTSVRLALGYALLFVASSLLLVGLLWWGTAGYLDRETAGAIQADEQAIKDELPHGGLPGAIAAVDDRSEAATDGHAVYLLANPALQQLAGNLSVWPSEVKPVAGWYQIPLLLAGRFRTIRLHETMLPGGVHLLVGRDIRDRAEIRALILQAVGWAAAGALVIAIVGGLLVRRAILRRVESINSTASAIVNGDLSRRLRTRDTSDEFDQLAQTINLMLGRIERLVEGVRNTANAIAHDLRTPLAELRAQLEELIRAPPAPPAMFDGVQKAVADIDRVIRVFNALLRLAEIDSGVRRSGFRRVEIDELVAEVAELYGPLIDEKNATLAVDARGGLATHGDPYLLAQAVGNLVDNAVKYAPHNSVISVRVARRGRDGERIEIAVADRGPGIAETERPHVTERFYRGRTNNAAEGIGLGLSLVDAVARLHDGALMLADNEPGLIATLTLPAAHPGRKGVSDAVGIERALPVGAC